MIEIYVVLIGTIAYGRFRTRLHAEKYQDFLKRVEGVEARIEVEKVQSW